MKKSAIFGFLITGLLAVAGVIYYGLQYATVSGSYFPESGYVLVSNALDSSSKKVEFSAGSSYQSGADGNISFMDIQENDAAVEQTSFVHYSDDSLAAMGQGLIVKLDEVENSTFINHYSISSEVVLYSANNGYQVDNQGVALDFEEFIWKTSEDTYMIVAQALSVNFGGDDVRAVEGFVEISYVDSGVVQIQTQDNLWQTISPVCSVIVGDIEIHLVDRYISDSDGNPVFYLSNMVIHADDTIVIHNIDQVTSAELSVPKFDITTEDGIDGVQGDEGVSGEQGEQGVEGQEGEQGEQGVQGDPGEDGTAGAAGEMGEDGDEGEEGDKGNKGSTGSSGATGGAGSTSGDDSTVEDSLAQPTFSLTSWSVSSTSITFTLQATDDDSALLNQESQVYLVDMSTGQIVYETAHNFSSQLTYTATLPDSNGVSGSITILNPDTQYRLVVYGEYEDIDANVYGMEFYSKSFYTDSSGVFIEASYAGTEELSVMLTRKDYSLATSATVYLFDSYSVANSYEDVTDTTLCFSSPENYAFGTVGTEESTTLSYDISRSVDLEPDTTYYFRVSYTTTAGTTLTTAVLEMTTLKETPTVNTPTVITNRGTYTFDVYPSVDNYYSGIESVTYYVYHEGDYSNDPTTAQVVTTIKTNHIDLISIPVDGITIKADYSYVIVMEVAFNDNEKLVYISSPASTAVTMSGVQMPPVIFTFADGEGAGSTSADHESISGSITINANSGDTSSTTGADVLVSPTSSLFLTVTAPGVHLQVFEFTNTVEPGGVGNDMAVSFSNNVYTIENINLTSLKEATQYTFTVSGYVDFQDGNGYVQTVIGNVVISTPYAPTVNANYTANSTQGAFSVTMSLSEAEDGTVVTDEAMSKAEVMEVSIYRGTSTDASTLVETIQIFDTDSAIDSSSIKDNYYGDGVAGLTLTEDSFTTNLTSGTYTISVSAIYDYTYTTVPTSKEGIYLTSYINEIPVNESTNAHSFSITASMPAEPSVGDLSVMTITNSIAANYGGVYDSSLASDAIVGYLLTSKYDDSASFGVEITYYAFEAYGFNSFENSMSNENVAAATGNEIYDYLALNQINDVFDPIICGEELFKSDGLSITSSVPQVVFLFGDAPDGTATTGVGSTGYTYYYTGDYDHAAGTGISRGMQLTFAYVVGYNNYLQNEVIGYYPYNWYDGPRSGVDALPKTRSYTQDAPRSRPLFYTYPWASDDTYAVWKYWMYDADGTVDTNGGTARLLLDGVTYNLNNNGDTLPGLGTTDTAFTTDTYAGGSAFLNVSNSTSVSMSNVVVNLSTNTASTKQMSTDVTFYNEDLYPDGANLDTNYISSSTKNTNGTAMTTMTLFRVDGSSVDTIDAVEASTLLLPTYATDTSAGTYTVDFSGIFPYYSLDEGAESYAVASTVEKIVAGVRLTFTSGAGTANETTVTLYKNLGGTGKVEGSLSELVDVALAADTTLTIQYAYPNNNRGYYNVSSTNQYALRGYYQNGVGGSYQIADVLGDALQSGNYGTMAVVDSYFTSNGSASLGTSANYNVYSLETESLITGMSSTSQANMYYTGSAGSLTFMTPVDLSFSSNVEYGLVSVPYGVPEMDLDADNIEKTIDSITFTDFDIYGATDENIGDTMYFTISYYDDNNTLVYLTTNGSIYWPVDLSAGYGNLAYQWTDLERDTRYTITAWSYANGGTATTPDMLTKYGSTDKAVYYVTTSSEVEVNRLSSNYVVASYESKYFEAYFSLSESNNMVLEYEIYNSDGTPAGIAEGSYTPNADGTYSGYTPIYYQKDSDVAYEKDENYVKFDFGFDDYPMLDAGTYYMEVRVISTNGSEEVLGSTKISFTVPEITLQYVGMSSTPTYTTSDTAGDAYGLDISVAVLDEGRWYTADSTTNKGEYVLKLFQVNEDGSLGNCAYTSAICDTGNPMTHYITDLDENTTYMAVFIALKDVDSDGLYNTSEAIPSLAEFLAKVEADMVGLADDYEHWYTIASSHPYFDECVDVQQFGTYTTMEGDGVYYEGVNIVNSGASVYVQFTGGIGLENTDISVSGSIVYYTADGGFGRYTVDVEDATATNLGSGVYRIDTGFDIQNSGKALTLSNFIVTIVTAYDDQGNVDSFNEVTLSGDYVLYS